MPTPASQRTYVIRMAHSDEEDGPFWDVIYDNRGQNYVYYTTWRSAMVEIERRQAVDRDNREYTLLYQVYNQILGVEVEQCPDNELIVLDPTAEKKNMVNVKFGRKLGKLFLYVNAQGLHETLDSIGCQTDEALPKKYKDRPYVTEAILNSGTFTLSTEVFLIKVYPIEYDLTTVFAVPPTVEQLKKLAQSSYEQVRKILEHYQPIDIQVDIQKKLLKEV